MDLPQVSAPTVLEAGGSLAEKEVRPDYAWRNTARWILFPWSALPPVTIDAV
jgi:hypothetical protein